MIGVIEVLTFVEKIETTTDKNVVNTLLEQGWVLIDVVSTFKKEFLFLLAFCNERRASDCRGK